MTANQFFNSLYSKYQLEKREIDLVICYMLDINTAGLFIFDKEITLKQQQKIHKYLEQRCQGMPLAYITGHKEFWSLELKVNQHTLIPRPETEQIIELILDWTSQDYNGEILDLGTGTGAIALSIASERPQANITAVDFSQECIEVAQYNKIKHTINNVKFFKSDWFSNLNNKQFHYIISNPPYIAENDKHLIELKHEPITALTAKENGLSDLKHIIQLAKHHLHENGVLILEHGFNQQQEIQTILKQNCYINVKTHKDLAGLPRITSAVFQNIAINK